MCKLQGLSTVEGGECSHPEKSELLCLPNIESLAKLPSELSAERLALTLYLPVDSVRLPPRSLFAGTVRNYYAMTIILNGISLKIKFTSQGNTAIFS